MTVHVVDLPVTSLTRDPHNRSPEDLDGLAESIREIGVLQPLLVRPTVADDTWMIRDGERRWTAACIAGVDTVPCIIGDIDEKQAAVARLVANLLRRDYQPLEEAELFAELRDVHKMSQRDIAAAAGCGQSQVQKRLALLKCSWSVKKKLAAGKITVVEALDTLRPPKPETPAADVPEDMAPDLPEQANEPDFVHSDVSEIETNPRHPDAECYRDEIAPESVTADPGVAAATTPSPPVVDGTADGDRSTVKVAPEGHVLVTLVLGVEPMERLRYLAHRGMTSVPGMLPSEVDRSLIEYVDEKIALARQIEPQAADGTEAAAEVVGEVEEVELDAGSSLPDETLRKSPAQLDPEALPWSGYEQMTVADVIAELDFPSIDEAKIAQVRDYEAAHGARGEIVAHCAYLLSEGEEGAA